MSSLPPQPVIPRLLGGLGNQLFQVAAAVAISELSDPPRPILLPSSIETENPHKKAYGDYRDTIFSLIGQHIGKQLPAGIRLINPQPTSFSPWNPENISTEYPVILLGYFQFLPALVPIMDDFIEDINMALSAQKMDVCLRWPELSTVSNARPPIFLHIRRGDYLEKPDFHYNLEREYYEKALSYVSSESTLFIVSDDPQWCWTQKWLWARPNTVIVEESNELITLALMSLCRGGAICANSSFSWWGAMLSGTDTVVIPTQWCKEEPVSLFPEWWVRIKN